MTAALCLILSVFLNTVAVLKLRNSAQVVRWFDSRKRQNQRRKGRAPVFVLCGIADFIDALILCLEAGLTLPAAFRHATREIPSDSELRKACEVIMSRNELGLSFVDSIRGLTDTPAAFTELLDTLAISLRMGSNVSLSLEALSQNNRRAVKALVEEQAARAPVKMLFPLVLFILPVLFLLLGAGTVRDLLHSLGSF